MEQLQQLPELIKLLKFDSLKDVKDYVDDATYEEITKNLYKKPQEKSAEANAVKYQTPDLNSALRPFPGGGFAKRIESDAEKSKSGNSR